MQFVSSAFWILHRFGPFCPLSASGRDPERKFLVKSLCIVLPVRRLRTADKRKISHVSQPIIQDVTHNERWDFTNQIVVGQIPEQVVRRTPSHLTLLLTKHSDEPIAKTPVESFLRCYFVADGYNKRVEFRPEKKKGKKKGKKKETKKDTQFSEISQISNVCWNCPRELHIIQDAENQARR